MEQNNKLVIEEKTEGKIQLQQVVIATPQGTP